MIHHVLAEFGGHGRVKWTNCEDNVRVVIHSANARIEPSLEKNGYELRQMKLRFSARSIKAILSAL